MNLSESVSKLQTLLSSLNASDAKFASSLIAAFKKYGGLTPKQAPWIEKLIVRAETPKFQVVASFPATEAVNVGGFEGVIALFNTAKEHLKFPKVRLAVGGTKVILSLNGAKSKAPGAVAINGEGKYPNRTYYGRVTPDGAFIPAQPTYGQFLTDLSALLSEFASNPTRVAKDHGKLTGNCCFCGKVIGDGKEVRSVLVGFGPDCAEHYGLKAEWLAAADKAEAAQAVSKPTTLLEVLVEEGDEEPVLIAPEALEAVQEPTLTVTPEAQAVIEGLAVDLAAGKDETVLTFGLSVPVKCFFCETPSTQVKELHGYAVCYACVAELK